ncbi:MAG TPA: hypothetical protein VHE14_04610 [Solirubrobacteraceae bacterium]|nr:hypothetical protein [Solirubrobacteraceae bacterium]
MTVCRGTGVGGARAVRVVAVAGALAWGAAGCGSQTVDASTAEKLIDSAFSGLTALKCPKNVVYKKGKTFTCNAFQVSLNPNVGPGAVPTPGSNPTALKSVTVTVHMIGGGKIKVGPGDYQSQ